MPFPIDQPPPLTDGSAADVRALHRYLDTLSELLNRNFDELSAHTAMTKEEST